jgi:hypothetical protein
MHVKNGKTSQGQEAFHMDIPRAARKPGGAQQDGQDDGKRQNFHAKAQRAQRQIAVSGQPSAHSRTSSI